MLVMTECFTLTKFSLPFQLTLFLSCSFMHDLSFIRLTTHTGGSEFTVVYYGEYQQAPYCRSSATETGSCRLSEES